MSEHLLAPEMAVKIAGTTYVLDGSFSTLKALQHAFSKDIVDIQADVMDMRLDEFAKMLSILVSCSGGTASEDEIGSWLVDEVGIGLSKEYLLLRVEIVGFLTLAMVPKRDRQKKRQEIVKMVEGVRTASHGKSTGKSPSESLDGAQSNSGDQTSGT